MCYKEVSMVFQKSFLGASRHFKGSLKEVQCVFEKVSNVFQGSFKGVSRKVEGCS